MLAGGCAGAGGQGAPPPRRGAGGPTSNASIEIAYTGGDGGVRRARIICAASRDAVTGFLRLEPASEVCRRVAELRGFLTSRPPRDRVCAQVYGGPERARFTGRLAGRRVLRRFTRTDACQVKDWDTVSALLPR
jgi:hypothetical protein